MNRKALIASAVLCGLLAGGCHSIDDDRIPPAPVFIPFQSEPLWTVWGTPAAMDWRIFIRDQRIPAGFGYTAASYTGFGGVLLTCSAYGEPMAFDLACPVERSASVRVAVNTDKMVAECPECHSTYDVFTLPGHPLSGRAADRGYGLKVYSVGRGRVDYMVVSY